MLVAILLAGACCADDEAAQREFFENHVRPLLSKQCYECHGPDADERQGGLRVDHGAFLLSGGDTGPAVVAGEVDDSLLIEAVRFESYEMPPSGKLSDDDIGVLERWVSEGAYWPEEPLPEGAEGETKSFDLDDRRETHWAWQPVQDRSAPEVSDPAWSRDTIDRFILAGLEDAGLSPARPADRSTLVRRLTFALTGLPPTPEEVVRFEGDGRPDAMQRLLDRLIASPEFGNRWGRHWLDLVRYAESRGHEFDADIPSADRYRDYVVRGLNADVPYDQWVREHIAGDLMTQPRMSFHDGEGGRPFNESILGTGFWHLGEWVHSPVDIRKDESDRIDNMIDVMSKTFQGVTVACARCHDHKFDAISTADYYSLTGFLQSSDYAEIRFDSIEHNRQVAKQLQELDESHRKKFEANFEDLYDAAQRSDKDLAWPKSVVHAFDQLDASDYRQNGFAFGAQPTRAGEPHLMEPDSSELSADKMISLARNAAAKNDVSWNGLESIRSSVTNARGKLRAYPRAGRTLRLPTFALTEPIVSIRIRGTGNVFACVDSHRLVDGPLHGETIVKFNKVDGWVQLNLGRYLGHRLHLEFTPAENQTIEVLCVAQSSKADVAATRRQIQSRLDEQADRTGELETQIRRRVAANKALRSKIAAWQTEWFTQRQQLVSQIQKRSRVAIGMIDGSGEDAAILIRGNSSSEGDIEPRHFLTAITGGERIGDEQGSGRLELADEINDPHNPLTSRVITNRLWHHLMGRGIVPTTDDFGVLGMRPTHPELLDHLATDFDRHGRHLKWMIRRIALTSTYQMSMQGASDEISVLASTVDPKNERLHQRNLQRLEGEVLRDSLLAISGQLDRSMEGGSVPVHLTSFMKGRGRPAKSGPMDGDRRRSIYIAVRRNFLSPMMSVFDTPNPFSTMGRRNVSNVPAQALVMLNDPFVREQARLFAERAMREVPRQPQAALAESPRLSGATTVDRRIDWMIWNALGRPAKPSELQSIRQYLTAWGQASGATLEDVSLWANVAHAIVNTKEFVFVP
ncbi:PSD1 and planctomycete cytochrome C domain-containing protein [Rhodopirellula sp. P2]|nr:PSD1 and planctomycete cytochrome C domain-containing protein [Rhodopirellula sp. P2]WDQ19172.1 PSD1 and planctomycete cytochrome C domain-containing protein [Rhodopirellula sp. P2]